MQQPTHSNNPPAIHWGHFAMVLGTVMLLLGATWLKSPELFAQKPEPAPKLPSYYAYVQPEEFSQPQVAGANTIDGNLPSVLNEDGTVSQTISLGEVLGVSTEDLAYQASRISLSVVPDSDQAIKEYLAWLQSVEFSALDNLSIEAALSSSDQALLNQEADKFQAIADGLAGKAVPESLVKLHRLKILQYQAGIKLLRNFTLADENPEEVSNNLGIFAQAQQEMESEAAIVGKKYEKLLRNVNPALSAGGEEGVQ